MLPRSYRLPSTEIEDVMHSGKKVYSAGVELIYQKSTNVNSRFAFIVSTRVSKKAVVRNRIRRIISESVRHLIAETNPKISGVFVVKRDISGLKQIEAQVLAKELLQRVLRDKY
jgi:ribonuclease P protein component